MKTVVVTGANRGLGLEFCQQYAEAGWEVIAACRDVVAAKELNALALRFINLQVISLDIADHQQINEVANIFSRGSIDVFISNAGVYGDTAEHGFGALDYAAYRNTLEVNLLSAVKLSEAFHLPLAKTKGVFVSISSLMGSIEDNQGGGSILYRSSKAALNAAMKSVSIDIKASGVGVLILHPGWVRTDMGGPNGLIDAPESVQGMRERISAFDLSQTGQFIKYDGTDMPW